MKSWTKVKAEDVFRARKEWLRHPNMRNSRRLNALMTRYEERFPRRRLNLFDYKVVFRGF